MFLDGGRLWCWEEADSLVLRFAKLLFIKALRLSAWAGTLFLLYVMDISVLYTLYKQLGDMEINSLCSNCNFTISSMYMINLNLGSASVDCFTKFGPLVCLPMKKGERMKGHPYSVSEYIPALHCAGIHILLHYVLMDRSGRPSYSDSWVDQVNWLAGKLMYYILLQVWLLALVPSY